MLMMVDRDVERTEYLLKRNDEANGVELSMLELANNEVELSDLDDSHAFSYSYNTQTISLYGPQAYQAIGPFRIKKNGCQIRVITVAGLFLPAFLGLIGSISLIDTY